MIALPWGVQVGLVALSAIATAIGFYNLNNSMEDLRSRGERHYGNYVATEDAFHDESIDMEPFQAITAGDELARAISHGVAAGGHAYALARPRPLAACGWSQLSLVADDTPFALYDIYSAATSDRARGVAAPVGQLAVPVHDPEVCGAAEEVAADAAVWTPFEVLGLHGPDTLQADHWGSWSLQVTSDRFESVWFDFGDGSDPLELTVRPFVAHHHYSLPSDQPLTYILRVVIVPLDGPIEVRELPIEVLPAAPFRPLVIELIGTQQCYLDDIPDGGPERVELLMYASHTGSLSVYTPTLTPFGSMEVNGRVWDRYGSDVGWFLRDQDGFVTDGELIRSFVRTEILGSEAYYGFRPQQEGEQVGPVVRSCTSVYRVVGSSPATD